MWQLATGEISVCWKYGQHGHIGDRCHQDVSALAASLASPSNCQQPSWALVVRGGLHKPSCPQVPAAPAMPMPTQVGKLTASVTAEALVLAKSCLTKQDYQAANLAASWWLAAYKEGNVQEAVFFGDNVVEGARERVEAVETDAVIGQGGEEVGEQFEGLKDSQEQLASGDEIVNISMEVQLSLNAEDEKKISVAKVAKTDVGSTVSSQVHDVSSPSPEPARKVAGFSHQ